MVTRAQAVVVGAVVLVAAGACGDDSSKPKPMNSAGSSVDAGQAGMPSDPGPASGGSGAGETAVRPPVSAGSGGDGEAGAPVEPATDVTGQVFAGTDPFEGAVVVVGGVTTLSGADGSFVVHHAGAEYQLMVRDPKTKAVFVYEGLKTREPHVNLGPNLQTDIRSATVRGKLLGGGLADPTPSEARKAVVYVGKHYG